VPKDGGILVCYPDRRVPTPAKLRTYYLVSYASLGVFLPFISPWLESLGLSGTRLGIVSATRPMAGILAPLAFGWIADRFGYRGRLLRWACLGAMLPFVVLTLLAVPTAAPSFAVVLCCVALSSFFRVPMMSIADVAAVEGGKAFGGLRLWGSVGFLLTALLAGALLRPSVRFVFPLLVASAFFLAWLTARGFPERREPLRAPEARMVRSLLSHPAFVRLLMVTTLWATAHAAYDLTISLLLRDRGASSLQIAQAWSIGVVAEIVLMAYWSRLEMLLSARAWMLVGLLGTVLRFVLIAFGSSLTLLLCLQPLHAVSFATFYMAAFLSVRAYAPRELLATAQGTFSTACALGATCAMPVFGWLYQREGGKATFLLAALVALVATGVLLIRLRGASVITTNARAQ
jgi:MFS transporter, PPP family, 3-phenylpropionic acid transporter